MSHPLDREGGYWTKPHLTRHEGRWVVVQTLTLTRPSMTARQRQAAAVATACRMNGLPKVTRYARRWSTASAKLATDIINARGERRHARRN